MRGGRGGPYQGGYQYKSRGGCGGAETGFVPAADTSAAAASYTDYTSDSMGTTTTGYGTNATDTTYGSNMGYEQSQNFTDFSQTY